MQLQNIKSRFLYTLFSRGFIHDCTDLEGLDKALLDDNFGQIWISKQDSMFISANKNSNIEDIENNMLYKETLLVRNALNDNLFRYDASELMERRIGSDHLLYALKKYISLGSEFINEITEELDSKY